MFVTHRLSEDTGDFYSSLRRTFQTIAAKKIMKLLLTDREYNIQLVGATGVGKSCFVEKLLTNTFTEYYTPGAIQQASIAFPKSIGKVVFHISECRYGIYQPNLDRHVESEWANTDAFFVMISHQDKLPFEQSKKWIQTIRRIVQRDVPIVLVELKSDRRGIYNLQPNIERLCALHNIKSVQVSSKDGTNIHHPFLALEDTLRTLPRNLFADVPNIPITPLLLPPPPAHTQSDDDD